jgi:ADP-dependent NAD(P)H-hydrate dehydratase / NAD(P)H-hydrate epimerase
MIKVFRVAEMVAAEKAADASGHTYDMMMEIAGKAVAEAIIERYPVRGQAVTVLVGPGNNGGDGLVAGRYLAGAGADVAFFLYRPRSARQDHNYAQVQEMGLVSLTVEGDPEYRALRQRLGDTDILIDALLGTGVDRPIAGGLAALMEKVHAGLDERRQSLAAQRRPWLVDVAAVHDQPSLETEPEEEAPVVVAVDCPSGLNTDTGEIDALAIPAGLTVTFAGPKRGHFIFPGAEACGRLIVADIGIGPDLPEVAGVNVELFTAESARALLPGRPRSGHKGTFGWAYIAAGSARYWGAPALAGRGAYRCGAGLVALAVPSAIRPALATQLPEATYPLIEDETLLGPESAQMLLEDMAHYEALLVGPGLHEAGDFITRLFSEENRDRLPPTVVDADGLNLLARLPGWHRRLPTETVLTPHPGEMARLMGAPLAEVRAGDRVDLAQEYAVRWRVVLILKGAYTVVAAPDGRAFIIPFANPALGTAGSGDVLSGIVAGLLAQGMKSYEAAALGAYLHGAAAGLAGVEGGLLAGEIADWVPEVMAGLR